MYTKKVMIFNVVDNSFAIKGKQLCGMVKFEKNGGNLFSVSVFVTNADNSRFGEWWLILTDGTNTAARNLVTLNNDAFTFASDDIDDAACVLVKKEDKCYVALSAFFGGDGLCSRLIRDAEKIIENNGAEKTPYEQFVASSDNFYDGAEEVKQLKNAADGKYRSVEDYSGAFERYYAAGRGDNYYKTVKKEITKLFVDFPPYYPLIKKYSDSFFVRIDFPDSEKFFVLGILQKDGEIKYICYGLPGEKDNFRDKDFTYIENEGDAGFWMLFQDAVTGQITTLSA